jgi:hypothetical protein
MRNITHCYNHFAKFALCLQATSAPSERSFKSASFLYDKDRASLDEENIEKMVFIRENYRFVEDFSLAELLDKLIAHGKVNFKELEQIHKISVLGARTDSEEEIETIIEAEKE